MQLVKIVYFMVFSDIDMALVYDWIVGESISQIQLIWDEALLLLSYCSIIENGVRRVMSLAWQDAFSSLLFVPSKKAHGNNESEIIIKNSYKSTR